MSFFNKFKRALGFNSEGDDIDELDYYEMSGRTPYVNPFKKQEPQERPQQSQPAPQPVAADVPVPQSADVPQELMQAFAAYINQVKSEAARQIQDEQQRMKSVVEQAETKSHASDENLAQAKEKLAQSELQRRAAQTRANDLAARVAALEAEQEQLVLEKRSLLNKLKVMQVRNDMDDDSLNDVERMAKLADEIQHKSEQLAQSEQQNGNLNAKVEELTRQLGTLQEQLDEANANLAIVDKLQEQLQDVAQFKEKKNAEIQALKEKIALFEQQGVEADEKLKAQLKLAQEQEIKLNRQIDDMNRKAKVNAERQNRRDIDLANYIDDMKQQISAMSKAAAAQRDAAEQQHLNDSNRVDELQKQLQKALADAKLALTQRDQLQQLLDQARELQVKAQDNEKIASHKAERAREDARAARDEVKNLQRQLRQLKKEMKLTAVEAAPDADATTVADMDFPVDHLPDPFGDDTVGHDIMAQPIAAHAMTPPAQEMQEQPRVDDAADELWQTETVSADVIPDQVPVPASVDETILPQAAPQPEPLVQDEFGGIDDIDWLLPAEPNLPEPDPESESEPSGFVATHESENESPHSDHADGPEARQLSLF